MLSAFAAYPPAQSTIINHTVAYRVAVSFRAAPLAAPAVVRSTEDGENTDEKKPLATAIPVATLPNTSQQGIRKGGIACVSGLDLSLLATATALMYHRISTNVNTR